MKILRVVLPAAAVVLVAILASQSFVEADGNRRSRSLRATLDGFQETPAVSTAASGRFRARLSYDDSFFEYELRYRDLEGDITQSHIHFAQKGVMGGVSVWLCGTVANPGPMGTPACGGPRAGIVTGTVSAAQVIGPAGQGISPGEFEALLDALREGVTYANVHSTAFGSGEIRGQIRDSDRRD
jgi:hypothetical protein